MQRQFHHKTAAADRQIVEPQTPAMGTDQRLRNAEAKTKTSVVAAIVIFALSEWQVQARGKLGTDARSLITDQQLQPFTIAPCDELDLAVRR